MLNTNCILGIHLDLLDVSMKKNLVTSIAELQLQLNEIRKRIDPNFTEETAKVKEEVIEIEDYVNDKIEVDLNKPTVKIYYDEVPHTSFEQDEDEPSLEIVTSENGTTISSSETENIENNTSKSLDTIEDKIQVTEPLGYKITILDIPSNATSVIKPVPDQHLKSLLSSTNLNIQSGSELRFERPIEKRGVLDSPPYSVSQVHSRTEKANIKRSYEPSLDYYNHHNYSQPPAHSQNYSTPQQQWYPPSATPLFHRQQSVPNKIDYYGSPINTHRLPQHHRLTYPPSIDINQNYAQKMEKHVYNWYCQQLADPVFQERQKAQLFARYSYQTTPPQAHEDYTPRRSSTSSIPSSQHSPAHYHPYGHQFPKSRTTSDYAHQQNFPQVQVEKQKTKYIRQEALDLRATSTLQSMQNLRISSVAPRKDLKILNLHIELEISSFFAARKREIFNGLYKYVINHSTKEQFIKEMHAMNIMYKDYLIVASTLAKRYNYQRKRKLPAEDYCWTCMPQKFDEYFVTIEDLRCYARDNMNILAIVIHNLLEQYRDSFKYFLLKMFE